MAEPYNPMIVHSWSPLQANMGTYRAQGFQDRICLEASEKVASFHHVLEKFDSHFGIGDGFPRILGFSHHLHVQMTSNVLA